MGRWKVWPPCGAIDRPTKGLDVELSYDSADIATMRVMDFASRGDGGRVSEEPEHAAVRYRYDGWLFPRAGLVFAWTLPGEQQRTVSHATRKQPGRQVTDHDDSVRPARAA